MYNTNQKTQMKDNILIVPDVHGRTFWRKPTSNIDRYGKVIFLGDYLDPYPYDGISFEESLAEFKDIIELKRSNPDKVVLLLGNHDIHYLWPEHTDNCRRNEELLDIVRLIFKKNLNLFSIIHEEIVNGEMFLFSHAGITKGWLEQNKQHIPAQFHDCIRGIFDHKHYDKIQTSDFCDWLNEQVHHEVPGILADIGRSRGGYQNHGSIVWADVSEHHTAFIDYAYQIFGHTQSQEPTITEHYACLDCHKPFILLPNGLITPYIDDHYYHFHNLCTCGRKKKASVRKNVPTPEEAIEFNRFHEGRVKHIKGMPRWKEKILNSKRFDYLYHHNWRDIVFEQNGKYGVRSVFGEEILPPVFDAIGEVSEDSIRKIFTPIPILKDGKYYLADKGGKIIAGPYDKIVRAQWKYYCVCIDGKWGMLDNNCDIVIPIENEAIYELSEFLPNSWIYIKKSRYLMPTGKTISNTYGALLIRPQRLPPIDTLFKKRDVF